MSIDPDALASALRGLPATSATGPDLAQSLPQAVEAVCEVFDVTGAGLMLIDEGNDLRYVVATDASGRALERIQEEVGEGPCVSAYVTNDIVMSEDVAEDPRWPGIADAVRAAGVHAVLGVPARLGGIAVGSLNVYCDRPRTWDASEVDAMRAFSALISLHLGAGLAMEQQERVVAQLQYALDHRVVIERAVGFLMGRDGVDALAAFDRLRREARSRRARVGDVAAEMLAGAAPLPGGAPRS